MVDAKAETKAEVLSLEGKKLREIGLPRVFESEVDLGLIKRAVIAVQTGRIQPKGPSTRAGRDMTAQYIGSRQKPAMYRTINVEHARLPRLRNRRYLLQGRVAGVPHAVGGPRVHRLNKDRVIVERINDKERRKAVAAAIAATADVALVRARGHRFEAKRLPLVVEARFEELVKAREVAAVLTALNVYGDVEKAKARKKVRPGRGKTRGRKYKRAKSLLIVTEKPAKVYKAARNLEGVDVVEVLNLNAELLAPGTLPGRLTLWTEGALNALAKYLVN